MDLPVRGTGIAWPEVARESSSFDTEPLRAPD